MCGINGFATASATREAFIPQIRAVTATQPMHPESKPGCEPTLDVLR